MRWPWPTWVLPPVPGARAANLPPRQPRRVKLLTRRPVGERERLDNMSGRSRNRRLLLMVLAFGACFAGLLGKAFYLQVVKAAEYSQRAERQYLASTVLPVKDVYKRQTRWWGVPSSMNGRRSKTYSPTCAV